MSLTEHIQQHNARYASRFDRSTLALPPARRWAIVACMDARLTVQEVTGIGTGDAHITVTGYVYAVETGKLRPVVSATTATNVERAPASIR